MFVDKFGVAFVMKKLHELLVLSIEIVPKDLGMSNFRWIT